MHKSGLGLYGRIAVLMDSLITKVFTLGLFFPQGQISVQPYAHFL
jgi:hypothetical protein